MRRRSRPAWLWLAGMLAIAVPVMAQQASAPKSAPKSAAPETVEMPNSQKYRQLEQQSSILSVAGAEQMLKSAQESAQGGKFTEAVARNQEAITMLNQMSTFHQQLSKSFAGIDNRIADEEKQLALQSAIKRDEATYQLALIHRAQGKPELAVPLLVRITSSQNPTRELGQKAYQQLYEVGFVKTQYPRQ